MLDIIEQWLALHRPQTPYAYIIHDPDAVSIGRAAGLPEWQYVPLIGFNHLVDELVCNDPTFYL